MNNGPSPIHTVVPPLNAKILVTMTLIAVASLAGCLDGTYDLSEDGTFSNGGARRDLLYSNVWTGTTLGSDAVEVPRDYDHLETTWVHTGQTIGPTVFTAATGTEHDAAPLGASNGPVVVTRILPASVGTATIDYPATLTGAGTYTVSGLTNVHPTILLSTTWTERSEGAGPLDTRIDFYVPPEIDQLRITSAASGTLHAGFHITDPQGETKGMTGPGSTGASTMTVDARAGVWALHLNGPYTGAFTIGVTAA